MTVNLSNYPPGVTGNEDYFNPPDDDVPEQELPGMWSRSDFEGGDPDTRSWSQRAADAEADGDMKTAEFWRGKIADNVKKNGPIYTVRKIEATPNERAHMTYLKCECETRPGNCPRHDFPPEDIEIVVDIDEAESDPNEVIEP
jgi:hypothetical protein